MKCINIVGLILNIIGTGLVWKFGVVSYISGLKDYLVTHPDPTGKIESAMKTSQMYSSVGMGLIILGFLLQVIAAAS